MYQKRFIDASLGWIKNTVPNSILNYSEFFGSELQLFHKVIFYARGFDYSSLVEW